MGSLPGRTRAWITGWGTVGSGCTSGSSPARPVSTAGCRAVVAGQGTFEPAGGWGGDHHDGVPIFILSRTPEAKEERWPLVTYVSDVAEAMAAAKEAAGERDVLVHGATVAQLALGAGVLDEIQIHLIPVLLGEGRRLFEHLGAEQIELEPIRVLEGEGVTHLRYRVA